MTLLAEQPLLVSAMLAALALAAIYGWLQTGKRAAAVLGLVAAALIPLAWLVAGNWVTDREQIELLIYETADSVSDNDFEPVYQVIGDSVTEARARAELPNYRFDEARVTGIRSIELVDGSFPPQAEVDLNVRVTVSHTKGRIQGVQAVRRLRLRMHKLNGRWMVVEYQHLPPVGGPDSFSTESIQ